MVVEATITNQMAYDERLTPMVLLESNLRE